MIAVLLGSVSLKKGFDRDVFFLLYQIVTNCAYGSLFCMLSPLQCRFSCKRSKY